jgi:hypothetical protein
MEEELWVWYMTDKDNDNSLAPLPGDEGSAGAAGTFDAP